MGALKGEGRRMIWTYQGNNEVTLFLCPAGRERENQGHVGGLPGRTRFQMEKKVKEPLTDQVEDIRNDA